MHLEKISHIPYCLIDYFAYREIDLMRKIKTLLPPTLLFSISRAIEILPTKRNKIFFFIPVEIPLIFLIASLRNIKNSTKKNLQRCLRVFLMLGKQSIRFLSLFVCVEFVMSSTVIR